MSITHFYQRLTIGAMLLAVCSLLLNPTHRRSLAQDPSAQRIESDAVQVAQIGKWSSQATQQASGGSYLYSGGSENDVLSLTFEGTMLEVIFVAGPSLGTIALEVDGTVLRTVITTDDETAYAQSSIINYLTDEPHTLKVYAQEGGIIAIDAFVIPQHPTPTSTPTLQPTEENVLVEIQNDEGGIQSSTCAPVNSIHIVSRSGTGQLGNNHSGNSAISADGRFVAFESAAINLIQTDRNGFRDIYVYDRMTCIVSAVSINSNGQLASDGDSLYPDISNDGRYVSFYSFATNLVANDTNGTPDVFVHDRQTGTTVRASVAAGGGQLDATSINPAISGDGRWVTFMSDVGSIVSQYRIFVHEIRSRATLPISVNTNGGQPNGSSESPDISSNGRYVIYASAASDIVANDTNGQPDVFVYNTQSGITSRVSVVSGGGQSTGGDSINPTISSDGRYVAFESNATNLVIGDTNNARDIFLHDLNTRITTRVSIPRNGEANNSSFAPAISGDGHYIVYHSAATNLVSGDQNNLADIFAWDRVLNTTTRLSVTYLNTDSNNFSGDHAISADGRYVSFRSPATNFVPNDFNAVSDVFVTPVVQPASDNLAVFNPVYKSVALVSTLLDTPPAEQFTAFSAYAPNANGQWVMGDWNGDGLKTPGVYASGAFFYTNKSGESAPSDWLGLWIGIAGPPVAGRFHTTLPNDCIGAVEQSGVPTQSVFVLYYTCNLTGDVTPGIASQWLSSPLPTSGGFTGAYQFAAGDFNNDGLDSIAVRRGPYIAFGNVAPVQGNAVYDLAQYIGTPSGNDEGILIVGDWDSDRIESFGLFYQNGEFFYRNDLQFNSGVYSNQSIGRPFAGVVQATSWR